MAANSSNNLHKMNFDQVSRLEQIVGMDYILQPAGELPSITIKPRDFITSLKKKLEEDGFVLEDIRVNGSAASVVIGGDKCHAYNDLDILFNFASEMEKFPDSILERTRHDKLRLCVLKCLEALLPGEFGSMNTNYERLAEAYFLKYVLVQNNTNDLWSLVALRSTVGRCIELKFVDRMKRKYEFSIDSFQLIISEYLTFMDSSPVFMTQKLFPSVNVESVYGDFESALKHLDLQLISTRNPEEIRGGGLLKYCYLRTCSYQDADSGSMPQLNKYMCSRFFIDFPDIGRQRSQLEKYLVNHFSTRVDLKQPFLQHLLITVQNHAFCLPMRERSRTIEMIDTMIRQHAYIKSIYSNGLYSYHQPIYVLNGERSDSTSSQMYHRGQVLPQHQHCMTLQPVYFTTSVIAQAATIS